VFHADADHGNLTMAAYEASDSEEEDQRNDD